MSTPHDTPGSAKPLSGRTALITGAPRSIGRAITEEALNLSRRIGARGSKAWILNHYAAVLTATSDFTRASALH